MSVGCLVSILLLITGLKAGNRVGDRKRILLAMTGLAGLLYVGLDLGWYFYVGFLQSREIALAYYFASHLCAGVVMGMLLYITTENAKLLLIASGALLVLFNVLVTIQHLAVKRIGIGDGLFSGVFISSVVLLWLDNQRIQHLTTESENHLPTTD